VQEIADEATLNRAPFTCTMGTKTRVAGYDGIPLRNLIERTTITLPTAMEHCAPLHSACATILRRAQLSHSVVADGARRLDHSIVEDMFKEGLAHHGMAPGATRHSPRPQRPGPFWSRTPLVQTPNRIPAEEYGSQD